MKKINILLLLLLVAINGIHADSFFPTPDFIEPVNHCYCYIQEDGTVFIAPGSVYYADANFKYPKDWTLPEKVLNPNTGQVYTVTGTVRRSFDFTNVFRNVEIIRFPETYTTIEDNPAGGSGLCYSVKEAYGPGLTFIGQCLFGGYQGSKLEKAYFPKLKVIGYGCFRGCQLTDIDLPELDSVSMNSAGYIFAYSPKLERINAPKLRCIGDMMFIGCQSLKELDLPNVDTIAYITAGPIQGCSSLTRVCLPKVRTLKNNTIDGAPNIEEIEMDSLKWITGGPNFMGLTKLKRLTLPSLVTFAANSGSLNGCTSLHYLNLPKYEGDLADVLGYAPLAALDTLLLPSAKSFGMATSLNNLAMVDIRSIEKPESLRVYAPGFNKAPNIKHIICNNAAILDKISQNAQYAYADEQTWKKATYAYEGFDSVELINQTEALGDDAFAHVPNIKHIVLHNASTPENMKAFQMLPNLESIDVADDATGDVSSYSGVLYNAAGNTLLYYPLANETSLDAEGYTRTWQFPTRKITGVGPYALYKYAGKETRDHRELHISKGETCTLGEHALDGSSIDHVTFDLDAPLTAVGDYAMANMTQTAFRYLKMPRALQTIGNYAFYGDTQLQALELYDTQLTTVGNSAFSGQTAITSIALPNSVTTIGIQAFYGNTAMEYFTVPRSCTSIGGGAFANTNLKQLNVQATNETLTSSMSNAFGPLPNKTLLPGNIMGGVPSGFSTVYKQSTAELQPGKYYTISRSYPIDLSLSADLASFYRVITYNVDKTSNTGILYLERLSENDIAAVPANSPVVALINGNTATALTYTMAETEPEAWKANLLEGTPGAVRLDMQETDEATTYYNYLLSHPSEGKTSGVFNIVNSHEWYEESTRKGELTYLHIPYEVSNGTGYARRFVFSTGNATGINATTLDNGKDVWYNLQGQRVNKPSHGIFIRNGRKVIH